MKIEYTKTYTTLSEVPLFRGKIGGSRKGYMVEAIRGDKKKYLGFVKTESHADFLISRYPLMGAI